MEKRVIKKSKEDYLEAIYIVIKRAGACRVTDVAREIGFSKSSTSVALRKLEDDGCVIRDDWRVLLTDKGQAIAERVYERHNFFLDWFEQIGVDAVIAEEDACMIEHVLSDETYKKIRSYIQSVSLG